MSPCVCGWCTSRLTLESLFFLLSPFQINSNPSAWPFHTPVDTGVIADYLEVVKDPIDLETMRKRLEAGDFYKSQAMLQADMLRMCTNCKTYNAEGTQYFQAALELETVIREAFKQ